MRSGCRASLGLVPQPLLIRISFQLFDGNIIVVHILCVNTFLLCYNTCMENTKGFISKHKEFIKDAVIAIAIAAAVLVFIKPVIVSGESMLPNLQDHNYLLLSRQAYNIGEPKHGQVIVFPVEKDDDRLYIKRVIGIPGDTIDIRDGDVYVNGKKQNQSYTLDKYTPGKVRNLKIPKGKIFAMGDNRCNSQDSRSDIVGLIDIDNVSGVALLRLWPVTEIGTIKNYK